MCGPRQVIWKKMKKYSGASSLCGVAVGLEPSITTDNSWDWNQAAWIWIQCVQIYITGTQHNLCWVQMVLVTLTSFCKRFY